MVSIQELARKIQGVHTISTIQRELMVKKSTAVKIVSLLRKNGLVKTSGGGKQPRIYRIAPAPSIEVGSPGLYEIINKHSKIKLVEPHRHRIIGRKLSVEEAIIRAVLTKNFRTILASLALFNHIKNWSLLYKHAKENKLCKKIGALYDTAKKIIKVRKMDHRIRDKLLKAKEKDRFIIPHLKSKNFSDIQKIWKVYIPFNMQDLMRYKE